MSDLVDIIAPLPPPPAPWPIAWLVAGAVLVLLTLFGLIARRWWRHRRQRAALRTLRRVERALAAQTLDARQAAFASAEALRQAYDTPHLTAMQHAEPRWQALIAQLDDLRYRQDTPAMGSGMLPEIRHWIRRAPC